MPSRVPCSCAIRLPASRVLESPSSMMQWDVGLWWEGVGQGRCSRSWGDCATAATGSLMAGRCSPIPDPPPSPARPSPLPTLPRAHTQLQAIAHMRGLPTKGPDAMDRDFGMTRAEVGSTVVGHNPLFHTVEAWSSDTVRAIPPTRSLGCRCLSPSCICVHFSKNLSTPERRQRWWAALVGHFHSWMCDFFLCLQ